MQISAVIITRNEARNIERCLESIKAVADEIVILDSYSTDQTEAIARRYGVRFIQRDWEDFSRSKNYANEQAVHDFILSLDADEALSDQLAASILKIKQDPAADAYMFNRLTSYCGKWIRHCGWYPDRKLRLWDRRKGEWQGAIHEKVVLMPGAKTEMLEGDLLHYAFNTIGEHITTANRYSGIAADEDYKNGKKAGLVVDIMLNPAATFLRKYVLLGGFLDGYYGFVICRISAFANFMKYTKLRALYKKNGKPGKAG